MAVQIIKFEVKVDKETRKVLKALSQEVKRFKNVVLNQWLTYHMSCGSHILLQEYIDANNAWHQADSKTRGPKPKQNVEMWPKELSEIVTEHRDNLFPTLHKRVCDLVLNDIKSGKCLQKSATKSAYPVWMRVLTGHGEFPSYSKSQPIQFDIKNSFIAAPEEEGGRFVAQLKLSQLPNGKAKCPAVLFNLPLYTGTKKGAQTKKNRQVATLWKIVGAIQDRIDREKQAAKAKPKPAAKANVKPDKPDFSFCGSNLIINDSDGKINLHLCYKLPKPEKQLVDPEKIAFLHAGRLMPWRLRINGYNHYVHGKSGRHISGTRRRVLTIRWGKAEAYKYASSSRKGHGLRRALGKSHMFENQWKNFVKTANQQLASACIKHCLAKGAGKLVYFQPCDNLRDSRFIANVGKVPGRRDATGWDWHQVGNILEHQCTKNGIELITKKRGEKVNSFAYSSELVAAK